MKDRPYIHMYVGLLEFCHVIHSLFKEFLKFYPVQSIVDALGWRISLADDKRWRDWSLSCCGLHDLISSRHHLFIHDRCLSHHKSIIINIIKKEASLPLPVTLVGPIWMQRCAPLLQVLLMVSSCHHLTSSAILPFCDPYPVLSFTVF